MANALLTLGAVTRKAVQLFRNANALIQMCDRQYDNSYAQPGMKAGTTIKIRLPNDYTVRTGATASAQDTTENSVTMTVATQNGVDTSFSSVDLAMSIDDFAERILSPMINNLAAKVSSLIMAGSEAINNLTHNTTAGATVTPTAQTWLNAGAILDLNSAPRGNRNAILDPLSMSRLTNSLTGLFNPSETVSKQFKSGLVSSNVLGMDFAMDQSVILHTSGTLTSATVNGGSQTGTTLTVNSTTGTLVVGDVITIANVFALNRANKISTGVLQQFVITAAAAGSSTSLSIYPAITPASAGAYATVSVSPANSAAIATVVAASETYRKNVVFSKTAITMASADLPLPGKAVQDASRQVYDGISLRILQDYNSTTDFWLTRLDYLWGFLYVRPEWCVIVADSI